MTVIAVPNADYPPAEDALALAAVRVQKIALLTPELIERAAAMGPGHTSPVAS
jgi:hypothetical protein